MTAANITELFAKYLQDQLAARAAGFADADDMGEVIPHEAGPVQPVDPRLAWDGAVEAASASAGWLCCVSRSSTYSKKTKSKCC